MTGKTFTDGRANVVWTNAALHGDLGHWPPRNDHDDNCCGFEAIDRRRAVHPRQWLYLTQVHGNGVVIADDAISRVGTEADAAVTEKADVTLSVATADCGPLALVSSEGVVAAVHGGWRGLQNGVIGQAAMVMRKLGATDITAALGPCIHVECYEFPDAEIGPLVSLWGESVRGTTSEGSVALDLPAAVESACKASDINLVYVDDDCTACNPAYFSHRARKDAGRQVMLVWRDALS